MTKTLIASTALILSSVLSGCSGAAGETPVEIKGGLYRADVASISKGKNVDVCLAPGDDAGNVDKLVKAQFGVLEGSCSHQDAQRTGNEITGNLSCKTSEGATVQTSYTGTIAPEAIDLEGNMKIATKDEDGGLNLSVTLTRVRDCLL